MSTKKTYNLFYNPKLPFPIELTQPARFPVYFDDNPTPEPDLFCLPRTSVEYLDLVSDRYTFVENNEVLLVGARAFNIKTISLVEV